VGEEGQGLILDGFYALGAEETNGLGELPVNADPLAHHRAGVEDCATIHVGPEPLGDVFQRMLRELA